MVIYLKKDIKKENSKLPKKKYRIKIKVVLLSFFFLVLVIGIINTVLNQKITIK